MDNVETLLRTYFSKPYFPEYLLKKLKTEIKNSNYNFEIKKETKSEIIKDNFNKIFIPIFSDDKINNESYVFNNEVKEGESIENFKNLVYEFCKLPYDNINKKEILLYLFVLEKYKNGIITAIYLTVLNRSLDKNNIYDELFKYFISSYGKKNKINKKSFDTIYLTKFINNNSEENEISPKKISNKKDLFDKDNIEINYLKYEYYGPDHTKNNYILNQYDEKNQMIITLFSPDFLFEKKIFNRYDINHFQVYNQDNTCPGLFTYISDKAIKQLNNEFNEEEINDNIISNLGVIHFEDKTVGLYLDVVKSTDYYEIGNLVKNLKISDESDKLEVVCYSSTSKNEYKSETKSESESTAKKEENKLTSVQTFYAEYNSHVIEEQLSLIIINAIDKEVLNQTMERMPRIIFYFNLYIFKSQKEKKRIAFTAKEKAYGFEEADGVFYLHSEKVNLTNSRNIPFLHKARFVLTPYSNSIEIYGKTEIIIEEKSLIYMEVKNSFPLKKIDKKEIIGINETESLLYNIIRRSKKFYEIAKMEKKVIEQIHILFLYDSLLPKDEDMLQFINLLQNFLHNIKVGIKIKTIFDVIYFVNPANINMKRFSDIVNGLKKQNEEANKKINDLEVNNTNNQSQINNLIKENKKNQLEISNLKIENEKLKLENKEEINRLEKESQKK